ncbi:MAG: TrkA family potassium uptake protein [Anaerolineae bacterium]|jgi:trk system potassium uptake protein TrkA
MRLILVGGGETIETIYFLARHFGERGDDVTIVTPDPDEARMLARRAGATVLLGDGSHPALLEEAGARRADAVLALAPYDPDNLVTCQIAQKLYGVPRTLALVNDPDNEDVFQRLGITFAFSATRAIGSVIEGLTLFDEVIHLFPAAEGHLHVTEVVLDEAAPAVGRTVAELGLPQGSLVLAVIREEGAIVPDGDLRFRSADHLLLLTYPETAGLVLRLLVGEQA